MKISTWYNSTQNKYYTEYRQIVSTHDSGYVNNQGHILIGYTFFYRDTFYNGDKVFFSREAQEKFYQNRFRCAKKRVIRKIIKFLQKL